jgi:hypothetical protein
MAGENRIDEEVLAWATRIGLDKAVRDHPADVLAAADGATRARGACPAPEDPAAEPWPPMHVGGCK